MVTYSPVSASGNWSTPGLTPDYCWDSPHRAGMGFLNLDSYFPVGCSWNCDLHTAEALWDLQELCSHQSGARPSGRWVLSPPAVLHVWSVATCSPSESWSVGFFLPPWFCFCCSFSEVAASLWGCIHLWPLSWHFAVPLLGGNRYRHALPLLSSWWIPTNSEVSGENTNSSQGRHRVNSFLSSSLMQINTLEVDTPKLLWIANWIVSLLQMPSQKQISCKENTGFRFICQINTSELLWRL